MIDTMKTNLKKIFALSLISFALCGCNEGANVAILKVGFDKCIGTSSPTPQVGLAFTSKSKQSLNAAFDVYVGARKGFPKTGKTIYGVAIRDMGSSPLIERLKPKLARLSKTIT